MNLSDQKIKIYEDNEFNRKEHMSKSISSAKTKRVEFDILFGFVEFPSQKYAIFVTECEFVGYLMLKQSVWKPTKFVFEAIGSSSPQSSSDSDESCIYLMNKLFKTQSFYFSHYYDMTNSFQSFVSNNNVTSDPRFFVNQKFYSNFIKNFEEVQNNPHFWITMPVIMGLVKEERLESLTTNINIDSDSHSKDKKELLKKESIDMSFMIIARKEVYRLGTRFFSRGIDALGHVSNFAETEQILRIRKENDISTERVFSLLQIRGSIPIFWTQNPTLKYTPPVKVSENENSHYRSFKLHMTSLLKKYEKIVCINLVDKKGFQARIGQKFEDLFFSFKQNFKRPESINYVWFDYHHECKGMKVENCSKLMRDIDDQLEDFGYLEFEVSQSEHPLKVMSYQKGVVRTNCVDCLDRTNVVQSIIGRTSLLDLLSKNSIISPVDKSTDTKYLGGLPAKLERSFRDVWVLNGNTMSLLYAGTPALKTDFTKTGKRTFKGMIDDLNNSITR